VIAKHFAGTREVYGMQQLFAAETPTGNRTINPALGRRDVENHGGFLTPYYLFDLLERRHAEDLDLVNNDFNRKRLKRVLQQVQLALVVANGIRVSFERTWSLWYKELFSALGFPLQWVVEIDALETAGYGLVPVSHACYLHGQTDNMPLLLIDLHPFGTDLDKALYLNPQHDPSFTTEPVSRALEFALEQSQANYALLSNGLEMRLYRRGSSVARQYLKVDFLALFECEDDKEWLAFWGLFRLAAFVPTSSEQRSGSDDAS